MDLKELIEWTKKSQDKELLKTVVRTDQKSGLPRDGDILICANMLGEIRKRAMLVIENTRKAEKYMNDITEYLKTLQDRGVKCPLTKTEVEQSVSETTPEQVKPVALNKKKA